MPPTEDGLPTNEITVDGYDFSGPDESLAASEPGRARVLELLKENYQEVQ